MIVIIAFFVSFPFVFYLKIVPYIVSNQRTINYAKMLVKDSTGADLSIETPYIVTQLSPNIALGVKKVELSKNKKEIFSISNVNLVLSLEKILEHRIQIVDYSTDSIYADVNGLMSLTPNEAKKEQKSDYKIDWLDSRFYLGKLLVIYKPTDNIGVKIEGKNFEITADRKPKYVHFDSTITLTKNNYKIDLSLKDRNKVYIKNKKMYLDDLYLFVNNSKIYIESIGDAQNKFNILLYANNFDIKILTDLISSDLIVPNGNEILAFTTNIKGNFDFKINLSNKHIKGLISLKPIKFNAVPLAKLPVTVKEGVITFDEKNVSLKNIKGYYENNQKNEIILKGDVKDYTKSVAMNLSVKSVVNNDFVHKYLSKLANCNLSMTGQSKARIKIKSKNNIFDVTGFFKVKKGNSLFIESTSLAPKGYETALKLDLNYAGTLLTLKALDYCIAEEINKTHRAKPIVRIKGQFDIKKEVTIKSLGFEIPKALPSEFLNMLLGQKIFKKGTVSGNLEYINQSAPSILDGNIKLVGVRVPSQRLKIEEGILHTDSNLIHIDSIGRFRRTNYKFNGDIKNEMVLPVVVKDVNLTFENLDIEKVMQSVARQAEKEALKKAEDIKNDAQSAQDEFNENDMEPYEYVPDVIAVEKCMFNVNKGVYKEIKFGNLHANLTLTPKGILKIESNKFDFAEGISSCKVYCDLLKHKYSIRLGAKDVDSDLIATAILGLKKEISGKASALMEFYTDDSAKLNGSIKFIVKDGTIGKLGYVEYVLKVAALFRNPLAMISPSTVVDLVNIPEGTFKSIIGLIDIKDNVIYKMSIKSASPQLSSFVAGRFDLESRDASLRIYTKFSGKDKGFAGFLRNISLNSLANKVPLSGRNDSNYYASELSQLPELETGEIGSQVFLTKVEGDVEHNNFLSSLKKIK
ncbi:MAG: hypothetical protein PHV37_07740 [Candidatus Gastranaerophilales bacterium]|nr:hypothetical protein [Candidatus Gastranaerophilales bacterium]